MSNHVLQFYTARLCDMLTLEKRPSLAIVLHGKIGDVHLFSAPVQAVRAVDGAQASPALIAMCLDALLRHVIEPNTQLFSRINVIGHSWSIELGGVIDALLQPFLAISSHEAPPPLQGFVCANLSLEQRTCHRTFSHLLGLHRALELKRIVERRVGQLYSAVLISR